MSAELFAFTGQTRIDMAPQTVLEGAKEDDLTVVLVLGRDSDGNLCAYGSTCSRATNILLCREFEHKLLAGDYS